MGHRASTSNLHAGACYRVRRGFQGLEEGARLRFVRRLQANYDGYEVYVFEADGGRSLALATYADADRDVLDHLDRYLAPE